MHDNVNYNEILKNLNILYIEDQENIRENIKKVLELICGRVFDVECISDAKSIFNNKKIDIIISDINLPDFDGISFVEQIRQNDKKIPVILLTAYTDTKYLLKATKLKLVDYLTKPIDFQDLNNALNRCVDELLENSKYTIEFEDNVLFNVVEKKLQKDNKEINLTSKELTLLEYLINNSNRVVSQEELKTNIWDDYLETTDSALKNLLNKLRKKVGKNTISNISGVGYKINL